MLHSMINSPRPTRAEVSDIANAVNQHTDALMLSGETAYGKYPVEAIATMSRVAYEVEKSLANTRITPTVEADVTSFLFATGGSLIGNTRHQSHNNRQLHGRTARYISSYRGSYPTLAICHHEHVVRLLALSYGVIAMHQHRAESSRLYLITGLEHLIEAGLLTREDDIAYLGGSFGEGHGTSFLEINRVGENNRELLVI